MTTAHLDQWDMPTGFWARFTSDGDHVSSANYGGPVFDIGSSVRALSDGGFLLGGKLSGEATVGGISVSADVDEGQAFVARLDEQGNARWVTLTPALGTTWFLASDPACQAPFAGSLNTYTRVALVSTFDEQLWRFCTPALRALRPGRQGAQRNPHSTGPGRHLMRSQVCSHSCTRTLPSSALAA